MANICETAISILAGNLNLGRSYLITTVLAKFNLTIFLFWWQFRPIRPRNVPSFILMGTNGIEDGRKCGHEKNSFLIKVIYLKALVFKYFVS